MEKERKDQIIGKMLQLTSIKLNQLHAATPLSQTNGRRSLPLHRPMTAGYANGLANDRCPFRRFNQSEPAIHIFHKDEKK